MSELLADQREQMLFLQRSLQILERGTLSLWERLGEAAQEKQMQSWATQVIASLLQGGIQLSSLAEAV